MVEIICNRMKFIHIDDIESMNSDSIIFMPDKDLINLMPESEIIYQQSSQNNNPGVLYTETVSLDVRYNDNLFFIKNPLIYYVLKLYTPDSDFIVGSKDYPAILTYSGNRNIVSLSFRAEKHAI